MKAWKAVVLGTALCAAAATAYAQGTQYIPILSYRVGPYAAGGSGYFGGAIDYFTLVNQTGGINGVKISWVDCAWEFAGGRGVGG
jgi:branched-chain amino acid transport system substrate-binding protein